jgi:O-antigen biosynthesis protein WbqV
MGDPIRIIEFARRMIDAFGLAPGRDVPITVVGARPGEKLTEALVDDDEHGAQSGVAGILEVASDTVGLAPDVLARLEAAARDQDDALVLRLLDDICARRRRSAVA